MSEGPRPNHHADWKVLCGWEQPSSPKFRVPFNFPTFQVPMPSLTALRLAPSVWHTSHVLKAISANTLWGVSAEPLKRCAATL